MRDVRIDDILIEAQEGITVDDICGRLLGDVSKEQLMGVIQNTKFDTHTSSVEPSRTLPTAISFADDEE